MVDARDMTSSFSLNAKQTYIFYCVLFCGLYFIRDILGVNVSYYVIYTFAGFIVFALPKKQVIAFIISIASFADAGFNGVFSCILFCCVAVKFWGEYKKLKTYSCLLLLMVLYEIFHYLATPLMPIGYLVTHIFVLPIVIIVQQYPQNFIDKNLIVDSFIAFSMFFVLMTVLQMSMAYGSLGALLQNGFRSNEYTELQELKTLSGNQNYITSLCSLNLGLCALMISIRGHKFVYIMETIIFVIVALLTVSKMFIVVCVAFTAYVVFYAYKRNIRTGIGLTIAFLIAVLLVIYFFGDTLIEMVLERFQSGDLTTGRVDIIKSLLGYMKAHPLTFIIGIGIQNPYYYLGHAIHSSVFEVIGGWGISGLIIVIIYLVGLINDSRKAAFRNGSRPGMLNYLPVCILLGYSLIGMLFSSPYDLLKMMATIYAIQLCKDDKINEI